MMWSRVLTHLLSLALAATVWGCAHTLAPRGDFVSVAPSPLREVRYVMGTLLDITLYPPEHGDGRVMLEEAFKIAERLNDSLSTYKPASALSVFNADSPTSMRPVDEDLYRLVEHAQNLSLQTEGAFDVTVRPLVEMWKRAAQRGYPPTEKERAAVKEKVGYRKLSFKAPWLLGKSSGGVQIESGGIAKGMAVDEIVAALKARGVTAAFVNFGRSSMAAIGTPPGELGWSVTLELEEGRPDRELSLRDEALTVSRARGEPFVVAGVSYAHIFDPRTLAPIKYVRGAAIRTPSATDGEAYVKFLVLRGPPSKRVERRWGQVEWFVKGQGRELVSSSGQ
jgi:thiamine biosynthesis lipoprotein